MARASTFTFGELQKMSIVYMSITDSTQTLWALPNFCANIWAGTTFYEHLKYLGTNYQWLPHYQVTRKSRRKRDSAKVVYTRYLHRLRLSTFLSLFLKCVICCARIFPFFVRACLYHCVVYSADVGRILYINGYYFIFLTCTNVCSVTELT